MIEARRQAARTLAAVGEVKAAISEIEAVQQLAKLP